MNKEIYADNAATTRMCREVQEVMAPYENDEYGNPSSIYRKGRRAAKAVKKAREQIANVIGAQEDEIYFTSGGTESDNWAIKGVVLANMDKGTHIITTCIEHKAVLESCKWLEKLGFKVTYLPVSPVGTVDPAMVERAITDETILISVMMANNEIGTIEPVRDIGKIAKKYGVLFHTDAVQAVGSIDVDVRFIGCDLLSMSAHKFHGPKGIGALYIRNGVNIEPLIHGGGQQRGYRSGTENVAACVGMGKAIELASMVLYENQRKLKELRDYLWISIKNSFHDCHYNGLMTKRLPGNLNITIPGINGESILLDMDLQGICCSTGSACSAGSKEGSYVLKAIGLSNEDAHSSLRFTLSPSMDKQDVHEIVNALIRAVQENQRVSFTNF